MSFSLDCASSLPIVLLSLGHYPVGVIDLWLCMILLPCCSLTPTFARFLPISVQKDFLISTSFSNSGPASPPVPPIIEQGPSDPGETDPVPAKVKFSDSKDQKER